MKRFASHWVYLVSALGVVACFSPVIVWGLFSIQWLESFGLWYLIFCVPFLLLAAGMILLGALILLVFWLTRRRGKKSLPTFVKVGGGVALGLALSCTLFWGPGWLAQRGIPVGPHYAKFESGLWKDPASSEWNNGISERQKMYRHLVSGILPGKSKVEIEDLLGPSIQTTYFSSMEKDFIYLLGPQRGIFGIDSEWLVIWVDEEGYFDRYEVVND